jgi:hypothetical protein
VRTSFTPGVEPWTQLGIDSSHKGFKFSNLRFDIPPAGSRIFNSGGKWEIDGLAFESVLSDWIPMDRVKLTGTVRVGHRVFGPLKYVRTETLVTFHGQTLDVPTGLYQSAKVTIPSRDGLASISAPNDALSQYPDKLTLPLEGWTAVGPPGPIKDYIDSRVVKVWYSGAAFPIKVVFEGYALLE